MNWVFSQWHLGMSNCLSTHYISSIISNHANNAQERVGKQRKSIKADVSCIVKHWFRLDYIYIYLVVFFQHHTKQARTQLNMQYITISYDPRYSTSLLPIFSRIITFSTEISTKRCSWTVQGLMARSFEYSNRMTNNMIQLLNGKDCCKFNGIDLYLLDVSI